MWLWLYDPNYGLINRILGPIAHWFGTTPPDWVGNDALRWGVPAFVIMGLWTVGGGMLIYLAALKNVPASLYEAARIDGASAARQFFAVTLPMISPLIFFNLIIAIISSFQVFAQVYVMTNGGPKNATLFYVLYLYRQAFLNHNMGYASAMAWILFLIVLVLTAIVIRGSRRWVYYEGLKV
jgi:multiple sugar transport system permease protein